MKRIIYFILTFFLFQSILICQSVVISEYFNSNIIRNEWTELFVIDDNLNLAGFTLRDNAGSSGTPDSWQGGIRFKNHPLWNNIRAGTIIVINHRRNTAFNIDADKKDGYIELDAENAEFFEKRCFDCDTNLDWIFKALSLAQTSDIIQLLDAQDNHIHALAHIPISPKGDYINIPNPKICRNGSVQNNSSLRVVPGLNISAYSSGYGNSGNDESTLFITKGKPNNSANSLNENQLFWRKTRQPEWNSPNLLVELYPNQNYLEWNSMIDYFSEDQLSGYIITRAPLDAIAMIEEPIDGKIYSVGDSLGSALVIGVLENSNSINFYDKFNQACGTSYVYRVYAFRFKKDELNEDYEPFFARGRAYNESEFAQAVASKNNPQKIKFQINKQEICKGDSFNLKIELEGNFKDLLWYMNGTLLSQKNTKEILVKEPGYYYCMVINDFGCETVSDTFQLSFKPSPDNNISVNGNRIYGDTIIYKCQFDEAILTVNNDNEIEWFNHGTLIQSGISTLSVMDEGEYFAKVTNKDDCSLNTFKVSIKNKKDNFEINPKILEFSLNPNETYQDKTIKIRNLSNESVEINKVTIPDELQILHSPPYHFIGGEEKEFVVRFEPQTRLDFSGKVEFFSKCGFIDSLVVKGSFIDSSLYTSKRIIDLGETIACNEPFIRGVFQIHNPTNSEAIIYEPTIEAPFTCISPVFPYKLKGKGKVDIGYDYRPQSIAYFSSKMIIPVSLSNNPDTLYVELRARNTLPELEISSDYIEFPTMFDCDSTRDTIITVVNKSNYNIYPQYINPSPNIELSGLPDKLLPGESQQIKIRINFNNSVDSLFVADLLIKPCDIIEHISLKIKKQSLKLNFEKDTIDFGTVIYCDEPVFYKKTVRLSIDNYDSTQIVFVESVETFGSFKSSFYQGKELVNQNDIDIYFNPGIDGEFEGFIRIRIEPCNIVKYLYLKGRRVSPIVNLSDRIIDFGKVQVNANLIRKLVIRNSGEVELKIERVSFPVLPFEFDKFNHTLPITLEPESEVEIEFAYKPLTERKDSTEIEIMFSEPCQFTEKLLLIGESFKGDTLVFGISVPKLRAKYGENINIPIHISVPNDLSSQNFFSDTTKFDICYNPSLLVPTKVTIGNIFENSTIKSISFNETKIGRTTIDIIFDEFQDISGGVIAILNCRTLLGNSLKTKLTPENVQISSNRLVHVEVEEGLLELEGNCNPEDRLVEMNREPEFKIININSGQVTFLFNIISEETTKFALFNNLGIEIFSMTEVIQKYPDKEINLSLEGISSGFYHAILTNGNIIRKISFPVIK